MTTIDPTDLFKIPPIRDRAALELLSRYVSAERSMLEARMVQLEQIDRAINEQMESLGGETGKQSR